MDVPRARALRGRACAADASVQYRLGRFVLRNYGSCVGLVLGLALINCFWRLSTNAISDLDEARYGVAASEMLHRHALLIATYAGQPEYWNLKPPLGYWMQGLAFRVFGPSVFAMRLPAALCAIAVIALTMSTCRRWFGRRAALLAGLILTTCFGFLSYHGARSGDLDSALTLILSVAIVQIPRLTHSAGSRLLWGAMMGLGFLLKSFAILPFVAVTLAYLLWSGEWRRTDWRLWWPPLALAASLILGWALARSWVDGSLYFVERMVREDLFARATQVIDPETTKPWGYLLVLLDRFAPWPLIVVGAGLLGRRFAPPEGPQTRALLLWVALPLLLFSAAKTQHHWYLDPTYPGWAMLAALASMELLALSARRGQALFGLLLCLSLLFCETRVLLRIGRTDRRPPNQTFLVSLHTRALLPADARIEAEFRLSHSERFILQVLDGYRVTERLPDGSAALDYASSDPPILLFRRRHGLRPSVQASARGAHPQLIAESQDYVLLRGGARIGLADADP